MYKSKYLKYKFKYLNLCNKKNTYGGGIKDSILVNQTTYILVFGVPGSGKSTICNILMGQNTCESGISMGEELTKELQYYQPLNNNKNYIFIDVPGGIFYESKFEKVREELVQLIRNNNSNAIFKFICIMTLDSGRISQNTRETIDNIIEHFHTHPSNLLIIMNKLSKPAFNAISNDNTIILPHLSTWPIFDNNNIMLIKSNVELNDVDDTEINFNTETMQNIRKEILEKVNLMKGKSLQHHYPFYPHKIQIKYYPISDNMEKIYFSGPNSASTGILNDCKYIFFGDSHFSEENLCQDPCKQSKTLCKHYNITEYLSNIFKNNSLKGNFNDFYLEIMYEHKKLSRSEFNSDRKGFIPKLAKNFESCFLKENISTANTRCHYIDTREIDIENCLFEDIFVREKMVRSTFQDLIIYQGEKINYVSIFRKFLYFLYYGGYMKDFFDICIGSKDVINDLKKSVNLLLNDIGIAIDIDSMKNFLNYLGNENIFVKRDGHIFHRAGLQLYELGKENSNSNLADNIKKYLTERYIKKYTSNDISLYHLKEINPNKNDINEILEIWTYTYVKNTNPHIFDAMLLGRMFRQFGEKNHIDSTLKVVYAGNNHANTYIDFFENVLGVNMYNYKAIELDVNINKYSKNPNETLPESMIEILNKSSDKESRCVLADAKNFLPID